MDLRKKTLYTYSLDVLLLHKAIDEVFLVVPKEYLPAMQERFAKKTFSKPIKLLAGGQNRFESVYKALSAIENSYSQVLIHDAARPFITETLVSECLHGLSQSNAVSCAIETTDTPAYKSANNKIQEYPLRAAISMLQTPQAFDLETLRKAYSLALEQKKNAFTDDTSLVHFFNLSPVLLVPGNVKNIKITHAVDWLVAEQLLQNPKA